MNKLPIHLNALIDSGQDLLRALGGPIAAGIRVYLQQRDDQARTVLLDEVSRGNLLPSQAAGDDRHIAIIYHYFRCARMGAARVNLRLLAKGIVGCVQPNALYPDDFLPHVDVLASLSRDEITFLAALHRNATAGIQSSQYRWEAVEADLIKIGWDKNRVLATAGRAVRSGYVVPEAHGLGQMVVKIDFIYQASSMFLELAKTVDFIDALQREGYAASAAQSR